MESQRKDPKLNSSGRSAWSSPLFSPPLESEAMLDDDEAWDNSAAEVLNESSERMDGWLLQESMAATDGRRL